MSRYYGSGSGKVWLDYTDCRGSEESLQYCSHSHWGVIERGYRYSTYGVSIYCRPGMFTAPFIYRKLLLLQRDRATRNVSKFVVCFTRYEG